MTYLANDTRQHRKRLTGDVKMRSNVTRLAPFTRRKRTIDGAGSIDGTAASWSITRVAHRRMFVRRIKHGEVTVRAGDSLVRHLVGSLVLSRRPLLRHLVLTCSHLLWVLVLTVRPLVYRLVLTEREGEMLVSGHAVRGDDVRTELH